MASQFRAERPLSDWHVAGDNLRYCHGCNKTKAMAKASPYCLECAVERKAFEDQMVMPRPFMRSQARSFTIGHILSDSRSRWNPELPDGCRRLNWLVLPPFQRPPVWTLEQKTRFIESIWLELPIGSYAYNDPEDFKHPTNNWLVDGQQRITAILEYVAGDFPVFGHRFPDLLQPERFGFENHTFTALVTSETDPVKLEEIYDRLAYGGTAHAPKPG